MKRKKFTLFTMMLLAFTLVLPINIKAETNEEKAIEDKYTNVTVTDLDPNSIDTTNAIVIDNLEDYENLLVSLEKDSQTESISEEDMPISHAQYSTSGIYTSRTQSCWVEGLPFPPIRVNMDFTYTVRKNGSKWAFRAIKSKQSWISGLQLPVAYTWTQKSFSSDINDPGSSVSFKLKGLVGVTVIYKDLPKICEYNKEFKFIYSFKNALEK